MAGDSAELLGAGVLEALCVGEFGELFKSPTTAVAVLVSASVKLSPRLLGVFTAPTKRGICGGGQGFHAGH